MAEHTYEKEYADKREEDALWLELHNPRAENPSEAWMWLMYAEPDWFVGYDALVLGETN